MSNFFEEKPDPGTEGWVRVATTPDDRPGTGKWVRRKSTTNEVVVPTDRWIRVATNTRDQPGTGRWVKRLTIEDASTSHPTVRTEVPEPLQSASQKPYWQHFVTLLWVACFLLMAEVEIIAWCDSTWFSSLEKYAQTHWLDATSFQPFLPQIDHILHILVSGTAVWWFTRLPRLRLQRRQRRIGTAAGMVAAIASIDEFLQVFSHSRNGDIVDWMFSIGGVIAVSGVLYGAAALRKSNRQSTEKNLRRSNTTTN